MLCDRGNSVLQQRPERMSPSLSSPCGPLLMSMLAITGLFRGGLCGPLPARDRPPGHDGAARVPVLAHLCRGCRQRQRVLGAPRVLREQQFQCVFF